MMQSLFAHWAQLADAPSAAHVESTVRTLLESTSDTLLGAFLEALQVCRSSFGSLTPSSLMSHLSAVGSPTEAPLQHCSQVAESFHGSRHWHPCLSASAVKVCLQRVLPLLTTSMTTGNGSAKRQGNDSAGLNPAQRHRLQLCFQCQFPPSTDEHTRHDCAVLTMAVLKGAAFPALVAAYRYFVEEGLASVPVALRFLSNCGMCVPHVGQRGVSLSVYVAALAATAAAARPFTFQETQDLFVAPRTTVEPLLHARRTLLESGRELKQIEGGLVHVNAVLNVLGYAADVRAFYACRLPGQTSALRETPHSVMSCVLLRNAEAAVAALAELGLSRPEGWVFVPPTVVQCMEAVSRLVGERGTAAQVDALYVALIDFHNGALFASHYVELVLAGVCDRIRDLHHAVHKQPPVLHGKKTVDTASPPYTATPHEVLDRVIPVVRAALLYVGDELNADMILELVETALHVDSYATSLTAALVLAFRAWMDQSLCLQELLCRVDASTQNVPFLHYYALCYARDFCRAAVFDHLAVLWHVDSDAIWHRDARLSPSCQLWKCAACGRHNSDRYNYCLCSALRYSHVLCGTCGYAQDERLRQCLSCGTALLSTADLASAVARKAWQCRDCGARNPAKQTLLCFRCGQPTGPRFREGACRTNESGPVCLRKSFCDCHTADPTTPSDKWAKDEVSRQKRKEAAYAAAVGVCHACGRFKMDYAACHSAVWVCAGCQQRRSTLERICPSCPQVECLPHALCRESIEVRRVCRHCQHEEANPFTVVCSACGGSDDPFGREEEDTAAAVAVRAPSASLPISTEASLNSCANGGKSEASNISHWCFHCQHTQPWKEDASLLPACCDSCGAPCEERGRCVLRPRACGQCGEPLLSPYAGTAVCPHCAAYVEPVLQPAHHRHDHLGAAAVSDVVWWSAVTVRHTCEVIDGWCAQTARHAVEGAESRGAAVPPSPRSALTTTNAGTQATFLQRRPTFEKTLAHLLHEWTNTDSGLGAAAWLPMRMDVATVLGRSLNGLRSHVPFSLAARRLSALLKSILLHVDTRCGLAATGCRDAAVGRYAADTHFTAEELCHLCLGTHPAELCPFREDGGRWTCEECGIVNDNDDVGRYVCAGCLALRPVVQDSLVSTCWECHDCHRANVHFERYCMHCGLERSGWSAALLSTFPERANDTGEQEGTMANKTRGGEGEPNLSAADAEMQRSTASRDDEIPFTPARCHLCGLVYIEARCPLCQNHIPNVADAKGTVCEVRARHAFIQPFGTNRRQDRIFVDEALLQVSPLREGLEVHYTAELGELGRMQATYLRC
ncbi:hypothetical protein ABB37_00599 [Leptomonas pyrrhocoris]|uniref:RanBP2-type domain-containing protein n=1 Tax=Leptomonas pyrrhocoris TaxID=157538 RepID=A0A0N0E0H0_LEPPY|nr:hypothetical protein ABB37_00599 [Leptomonas pyrrhocoris]XP_015664871.1 hypothetical protein ABB37_00599 [Leptomonas pyrrhocoris]KPA86431.1 hypothetical protein ABB37_00599 [Leptomonas pyrrhocoris]KPA86432.1 hypothetical protein ABB37_00599 [Leptomonas pyrrhocoris]|eukprot:XP_015664870.1 hypothetical protein ABB37_00599 [Leptomonas pyrrhocoris]